jgi:hypothetical protein
MTHDLARRVLAFAARVAPSRVFAFDGRVACELCRRLFATEVLVAIGSTADGAVMAEPVDTTCPTCGAGGRPSRCAGTGGRGVNGGQRAAATLTRHPRPPPKAYTTDRTDEHGPRP